MKTRASECSFLYVRATVTYVPDALLANTAVSGQQNLSPDIFVSLKEIQVCLWRGIHIAMYSSIRFTE